MYLKRLKIIGFKSFAAKTVLDFAVDEDKDRKHYDITAVVGPNGSGKSNIVDAVRWALGEQSMKNLRGKKSEDIIFAGSGNKSRLGSAQVTLYLDNRDKKIPIDFSEVEVTRKIYRSGESEYLINNSRVRLIDIQDLLAKAGIGQHSHAIVNQGMADAILSATPIERRVILEDAAGVKPFQLKKERSKRRLENARRNLERVSELVAEIEPHLKTLKRQADRAQKGKEVAEKLREKQFALYSFLWMQFSREIEINGVHKEELGRKMIQLQRTVDKLGDEVSQWAQQSTAEGTRQQKLEKKREQLQEELHNRQRELVIAEGKIEIEKEKQKSFELIQSIPVDLVYVKEQLKDLRERQEELVRRIESIERMEDVQDVKEFARAVAQEAYQIYADVSEGNVQKKSGESSSGETVNLKAVGELTQNKKELDQSVEKIEKELAKISQAISQEIEADRQRRKAFFEQEHELRQKQSALNDLKDEYNESKVELARHEVRGEDLKNEITRELKIQPGDLPAAETSSIDTEELQKETQRLKVKHEQIGGIDPLVVKEYEETKTRYEFLTKESCDLERAINSLSAVIKEMDTKIKDSFESTFSSVNKGFSKYFNVLFEGGKARLEKVKIKSRRAKIKGEEIEANATVDAAVEETQEMEEEMGIEISACPPGKKITHLSVLSGGERALTSIALLCAVIAHNPPPFAILDEVEAALDEANSRRFGTILRKLSKNTQFVLVTHNRETMRTASVLYGVTMGADGISKLLSVRLEQVGKKGNITENIKIKNQS